MKLNMILGLLLALSLLGIGIVEALNRWPSFVRRLKRRLCRKYTVEKGVLK